MWTSHSTAAILRAPGVNQWWKAVGRYQITTEVAETLESMPPGMVFAWTKQHGFVIQDDVVGVADVGASDKTE